MIDDKHNEIRVKTLLYEAKSLIKIIQCKTVAKSLSSAAGDVAKVASDKFKELDLQKTGKVFNCRDKVRA